MAPGLRVLHVRRAQSAKGFRKEIFSQGSRQDGRGGSGFINVLRAGALSPLVERRKATSPGRPRKAVGTHSHHSSEVPLMTPSPTTGYSITSHICGRGAPGEKGKYEINLFAVVGFLFLLLQKHFTYQYFSSRSEWKGCFTSQGRTTPYTSFRQQWGATSQRGTS